MDKENCLEELEIKVEKLVNNSIEWLLEFEDFDLDKNKENTEVDINISEMTFTRNALKKSMTESGLRMNITNSDADSKYHELHKSYTMK